MAITDPKDDLQRYLQVARDAVVWKLDGLAEYDARRPLTPTGTNLLGLVKHLAGVEHGLLRRRPSAGRSREPALVRRRRRSERATCGRPPTSPASTSSGSTGGPGRTPTRRSRRSTLDAIGHVPWWPAERATRSTLHRILVHMIAETSRHAGHADIVRELIDGAAGLRADNDNLPPGVSWPAHRDRVETAARDAAARAR